MVELKIGLRTVDVPFMVRVPDVTEEMFDEWVEEDTKAELLDGVMLVHSPATPEHDDVSGFLRALMRAYAEERNLGRVFGPQCLVHLATGRKFCPDLFFFKRQRLPWPLPPKQFEGAPDLVSEVLSPSTRAFDLGEKRPAYRQAPAGEIWLIDLDEQELLVDRRVSKGYTTSRANSGRVRSRVLRGFWIDAAWLWADPLPNLLPCITEILKDSER